MAIMINLQLVEYFTKALNAKWGYVWGTNGELYTQKMADSYKASNRACPSSRDPKTYWTVDCKKWIGKMTADCSGGIVGAFREYNTKYSDRSANTFKSQFIQSGSMNSLPEIKGLALWRSGHIGIYIGNGECIEFRGTDYGCVKTKIKDRDFTFWGKLKDIEYIEDVKEMESFYAMCDGESVNVRTGRGANFATLGKLSKNTKILATTSIDEWSEIAVVINNKLITGFMSSQYVKKI